MVQNIEAHVTRLDRGRLPCCLQVPRLAVLPSPPLQQYTVPPLQLFVCVCGLLMVGATGFVGLGGLGAAKAAPARTIAVKVKALVKCILIVLERI